MRYFGIEILMGYLITSSNTLNVQMLQQLGARNWLETITSSSA